MENIWQFETARFTVKFVAEPEYDSDVAEWDETGEIHDKLESGELIEFCAKVSVEFEGCEIASNYLGGCIYDSAESFMNHRGISYTARVAKARRELRKARECFQMRYIRLRTKRDLGEISRRYYNASMIDARKAARAARMQLQFDIKTKGGFGSYFSDMVRETVTEAQSMPKMKESI